MRKLLETFQELNLSNYGPDDVDQLNAWAIDAYAELSALKAQEPVAEIALSDDGYKIGLLGALRNHRLPIGTKLYAAPVSEAKAQGVVQWPEADEIMQMAFEEGQPADDASGYCFELEEFDLFIERLMSEVARLNATPVQRVSAPDDMRSLAQRLREYNQNPHHINPMSEAFHILVADAANALSTACVPKEIAAAITWSEHLLFECGALTSTRAPSVHVYNKTFAAVNEARAMIAAAPAAPAADAWIPVSERLPDSGSTVIAYYLNSYGKGRTIRAQHVEAWTIEAEDVADVDTDCVEYSEQDDCYYLLQGWYECIDNWDEYYRVAVTEGPITHWMPLPDAPIKIEANRHDQ